MSRLPEQNPQDDFAFRNEAVLSSDKIPFPNSTIGFDPRVVRIRDGDQHGISSAHGAVGVPPV